MATTTNEPILNLRLAYHYAMGYHHGLEEGNTRALYDGCLKDDERWATKIGYDRGIADYCVLIGE